MKNVLIIFSAILIIFSACKQESKPDASEKLLEEAKAIAAQKKYNGAIGLLQTALKDNFESPKSAEISLFLGTLYKKSLKKNELAATVYQGFIDAFPNHEKIESIKKDYGSFPGFEERLKNMASMLYSDSLKRMNFSNANDFVTNCEIFALFHQGDIKSANYLNKGAEIAKSIGKFPKAVELYDWIYTKYPNTPEAGLSLFLKAFVYDNDIGDKAKAKDMYQQFLKEFPDSKFAGQAEFLLKNIDKTNEEIIESFEKK